MEKENNIGTLLTIIVIVVAILIFKDDLNFNLTLLSNNSFLFDNSSNHAVITNESHSTIIENPPNENKPIIKVENKKCNNNITVLDQNEKIKCGSY